MFLWVLQNETQTKLLKSDYLCKILKDMTKVGIYRTKSQGLKHLLHLSTSPVSETSGEVLFSDLGSGAKPTTTVPHHLLSLHPQNLSQAQPDIDIRIPEAIYSFVPL